jgi:Rrf2 family nitric oxide-sensitive transcriptional repressor
MRLTKSTGHAIRILIDCAGASDRLIKVAELSERLQITQQNVFKIVNLLAREGLIEAVRGRNGGVRLARRADQIRIGDVVRATEITHVEVEDRPVRNQVRNQRSRSGVNEILDDALGAFIDVLDQHTLADMVRSDPRGSGAGRRRNANAARGAGMTSARYRRSLQESS